MKEVSLLRAKGLENFQEMLWRRGKCELLRKSSIVVVTQLQLVRTAAGADLKLFSRFPLANADKPKLIDISLRIAKMDRKF